MVFVIFMSVCDEGYYGPKCELPCMCQDYAVCNFMTGICPNGKCQGDWKGKRCDESMVQYTFSMLLFRHRRRITFIIVIITSSSREFSSTKLRVTIRPGFPGHVLFLGLCPGVRAGFQKCPGFVRGFNRTKAKVVFSIN